MVSRGLETEPLEYFDHITTKSLIRIKISHYFAISLLHNQTGEIKFPILPENTEVNLAELQRALLSNRLGIG